VKWNRRNEFTASETLILDSPSTVHLQASGTSPCKVFRSQSIRYRPAASQRNMSRAAPLTPLPWPVPPALIIALAVRLLPALLLGQTFFQPDEYYQSLEPAHSLAFGYGHLTWEWRDLPAGTECGPGGGWYNQTVIGGRMRGWIWPGVFAAVYKGITAAGLGDRMVVVRFSLHRIPGADSQAWTKTRRGHGRCVDRLCHLPARKQISWTGRRPSGCESSSHLQLSPGYQLNHSSSSRLHHCSTRTCCLGRYRPRPKHY
jgi:hypothetical protein